MTLLSRDQLIDHLNALPPLPPVVSEMITSFGDEEVNIAQVSRQIAHDQGLTARVLRVANSPFYGLQNKVGTINDALVVLGFRAVRSMVITLGVNGAFRVDQCPGFDVQAYFRHGIGAALAARALAPRAGKNADLAFTAALLHDVGQLVLASSFAEPYAQVLKYRKKHDCTPVVAERDILGIDHAEVGAILAETWRFPEGLHQAIAWHHSPAGQLADSLANLVHIADAFAHALGLSVTPEEMVMAIDRTAWERLALDEQKCARVLAEIDTNFEESWKTFRA